ncbi:MAG: CheR family methyltransferase [Caldilineaceae bacterium]
MTSFFYDPAAFDQLKQLVLPQLFSNKGPDDAIRSWVVGCRNGEEAYSLAMLLLEYSEALDTPPHLRIFATDINPAALVHARSGVYPKTIEAEVTPERLARFFTWEVDGYRMNKAVRELVIFAPHKPLEDPPFSQLHLIVCRTIQVDFPQGAQSQIFELFNYALRRDGYLFLAAGESIERPDLFHVVSQPHGLFQRKLPTAARGHWPAAALLLPLHEPIEAPPSVPPSADAEAIHHQMVELYGPPMLLVNADLVLVYLSSAADRYLYQPPGEPTNHLLERIRPELRLALTTALHRAFTKQTATQIPPTPLLFEGELHLVSVAVQPAYESAIRSYALVTFTEQTVPLGIVDSQTTASDPTVLTVLQEKLARTEEELSITIKEFETTKAEMWAANEELQSMNEELRSVAGELETNKEELQSINEELLTVNQQYQQKVEALSQLTSKLHNLLQATDMATLFLDQTLRITWFTPAASAFFHLRQGDIGRPLAHFTHSLTYPHLLEDAAQVLQTLTLQEHEVRDQDGRFYLLRLLPYRSLEDQIEGVVITLIEITAIKQAEQARQASEERYRLMVQNAQDYAIFTLDKEGRIATWNQGCQSLIGYTESEAIGQRGAIIFTPEDRLANAPGQEFHTALTEGKARDERWHLRKDGSRFWGSGVMITLRNEEGEWQGFAKIMRDYTERKQMEDALRQSQAELHALNTQLVERIEARTVQTRQLAAELVLAEQKERERIAHILHDDLQQLLYALQTNLFLLHEDVMTSAPPQLLATFQESETMIRQIIHLARQLTVDLSPPVLQSEGLVEALRWLATYIQRLHQVEVTVEAHVSPYLYGSELRVLLFQLVRELLFNVVKHAGVQQAQVDIKSEAATLLVQVTDYGVGFDVASVLAAPHANGYGLRSIQERLTLFGGQLTLASTIGVGTKATIRLPLTSDAVAAPTEGLPAE